MALYNFGDLTMGFYCRCPRGREQGDHKLLGVVYYDHVVNVRSLYELHASTEEDPSCP
jgi:hypothetical protein